VGLPLPPRPRFNRGQYIADTALSFRGLPYKWGGTSPSTGMDCSGFIVAVCKKWHLDVPHSVTEQYHLGRPIRLAEIQPGDLMFFKNTYKPGLSHVAIYVGDNQFVDAGDEKAGVMLRELGPHGMEHWVGARRLDLSSLPPAPGEPLLPPHR
jgi:cell wall-associated NlpC family hydrolase